MTIKTCSRVLLPLFVIALILAAGLAAVSRPSASAASSEPATHVMRLPVSALAGIAEGTPGLSFGSARGGQATVGWNHRPEWGRRRALLRFDLSQLPPDADIQNARLVANVADAAGLEFLDITVAPILGAWQEGQVAWSRQPLRSEDYVQANVASAGRAVWDITAWARAWQQDPAGNAGLLLDSLADYPEDNQRTLNHFSLELTLAGQPTLLTLSINARRDPVPAGDLVEYELALTNAGVAAAIAPALSASLPAQARFVSASDGGGYSIDQNGAGVVRWNLKDLPAGRSYRVFLTLRVAAATPAGSHLLLTGRAQAANSPVASAQANTTIASASTPTITPSPTLTSTPTPTNAPATGAPTPTRIPTASPTPLPTRLPCGAERVYNGDFEFLSDGWLLAGDSPPLIVAWPTHGGTFAMMLGSTGFQDQLGDSIARQNVRVPADATIARLTFWYRITSEENDARYDWFDAMLLDPAGRVVNYLLKRGVSASEWIPADFDVSAYRGQTLQLQFRAHNDGNAGSTLIYLDDISLCAARPAGPEPVPAPWPGICPLPGDLPDYAPAGVPDFSAQQSDAWKSPQDAAWSYDGPAAAADVLWWLDAQREPADAPPPPNISDSYPLVSAYDAWDDHAPQNVVPLIAELATLADTDGVASGEAHAGTRPADLRAGLAAYLASPQRNLSDSWEALLQPAPTSAEIRQRAAAGEGVVLLLGFWQWTSDGWARLGGRYVALAGVGCEDTRLAVSDPLRDAAELGFPGDVRPAPDHIHPTMPPYPPDDIHNDAGWLSHDVYAAAQIDETWGLAGYAISAASVADSLGHNAAPGQPFLGRVNPDLPIATRVEYAIILHPRAAAPAAKASLQPASVLATTTLRLHITEEGRPAAPHPSWIMPILVTFTRPGAAAPSALFAAQTDANGVATITAALKPGQWELRVRGAHTLTLLHPWVLVEPGEADIALRLLPEGDANADNTVAIADLSLLANAYGAAAGALAFDPRADFNQDGLISDADIGLWVQNQGRRGDVAAQPALTTQTALQLEPPGVSKTLALGGVGLTLYPSNTKTSVGRVFPVTLRAESLDQHIDAAEIHLEFDPQRLQIVDASGLPATSIQPAAGPSTVILNRVDNQTGRIDFIAAQLTLPYPPTSTDVATFFVKAIVPAQRTWLRFATVPGRRAAVARQGQDVARVFYALNVGIEGSSVHLPLLVKKR